MRRGEARSRCGAIRIATALLLGLCGAVTAGVVMAWRAAQAGGWLADGLGWLAVREGVQWFDAGAAGTIGVAVVWAVVRRWRGRATAAPSGRVAIACLALVAATRGGLAVLAPSSRGPNLVLISVDTLRADRLSCYGYGQPTTPVLDAQLAGEGVLFEYVASQAPKTTPSHMTMLTSLYPSVHGVSMWEGTGEKAVLNPRVHTLAEVLRNAGYQTAAFTAGGPMHRSRGFDHGFEIYRHNNPLERAVQWLEQRRGGKFFLFFHTYDVHDPYTPPDEYIARFAPQAGGKLLDAARDVRAHATDWDWAHKRFWDAVDPADRAGAVAVSQLYDAGIRRLDDTTMTQLLGTLDRLGLRDDTLVVLISDHGEAFLEHGVYQHDDVYAETTHVPWIMRFPGRIPAGRRIATPEAVIDLMPTVLDLLGVPLPFAVQGRSVAEAARGAGPLEPRPVISEYGTHAAGAFQQAVRVGDERLVIPGGAPRLFDVVADPGEQHDLASERPERVTALLGELDRWRTACAALVPRLGPEGEGIAPDPDTLKRLRALGYVE